MDHPRPWLRLVDADDLDDSVVDFSKVKVRNAAGDKLGTVDGFVIDVDSARPYYVVVDAGGWFKSKHFLLPVGHARLDDDRDAIVTDLEKERVHRFPGFDKGEFETMSDADLQRVGEEISAACGFTDVTIAIWERSIYRQPDWWQSSYFRGDRAATAAGASSADRLSTSSPGHTGTDADRLASAEREAVVAKGGDTSPHPGGRAEPGDVIGIETGGEQTHVGDTAEKEDERRRDAERDAAKQRRG